MNTSNLKRCHDPHSLRTHLEPNTPGQELDVEENQEEDWNSQVLHNDKSDETIETIEI